MIVLTRLLYRVLILVSLLFMGLLFTSSIIYGEEWIPGYPLSITVSSYYYNATNNSLNLLLELKYPNPAYKVFNISMKQYGNGSCSIMLDVRRRTGIVIQVISYDYLSITLTNISLINNSYTIYVYVNNELVSVFNLRIPVTQSISSSNVDKTHMETQQNWTNTTSIETNTTSTLTRETISERNSRIVKYGLLTAIGIILVLLLVLGGFAYLRK